MAPSYGLSSGGSSVSSMDHFVDYHHHHHSSGYVNPLHYNSCATSSNQSVPINRPTVHQTPHFASYYNNITDTHFPHYHSYQELGFGLPPPVSPTVNNCCSRSYAEESVYPNKPYMIPGTSSKDDPCTTPPLLTQLTEQPDSPNKQTVPVTPRMSPDRGQ